MGQTGTGQQVASAYVPAPDETVEFLKAQAYPGQTPRFMYLDRREAHWKGLQYEHQTMDWWGLSPDQTETISPKIGLPSGFEYSGAQAEVPVRMKRPTAPLNLCKTIVERFSGLLYGDQRKPRIVDHEDPDTEDWLRAVTKQASFWTQMRAARNLGGATGSVLVTVHLRDGRFCYEVHNTKNLTVLWADRRTWTPRGVLKMYSYPVEVPEYDKAGNRTGTKTVEFLYRRIITSEVDIVFKPVPIEQAQNWDYDPQLAATHNEGYFPGVWIQNTTDPEEMDGDADCEGAWQMLDTLDRMVAQINKAALMNLDPTLWTAVKDKRVAMGGDVRKGSENALNLGEGGTAGYLEMTGAGVEIGIKISDLLIRQILALTRCVIIDPEKISGAAQSAKAIEYMFSAMIERADEFRAQYGEGALKLLKMTERMGHKYSGKPVVLGKNQTTGDDMIGRLTLDLPPKILKGPDGASHPVPRKLGPGGSLELVWGPYFTPSELDEQQRITNAVNAKAGGLVRGETATRHVADVFGLEDPEVEAAGADKEADATTARLMAGMDEGGGVPYHGGNQEPKSPAAGLGGKP